MEARIRRFQELTANPWFNVMNWVLDEMRTPIDRRWIHLIDNWVFYGIKKPPQLRM